MRTWIRCTAWLVLALPWCGVPSALARPQPTEDKAAEPQVPESREEKAPGEQTPGEQAPGEQAPGEQAPGEKAPDQTIPPDMGAGDQSDADAAMEGEEDEPDPARPSPQGKGAVWGVVTDSATKEPVIDATVTVVGTKYKAIADLDGRFRLALPPGTYELRVWYELYQARRVQNLRVTAGHVERVDVLLDPDQAAEEEIDIELDPVRASAAAQLAIRKNAPTVGDAVSAQDIAKTPDRNAADAARRVVGATVVGSKYVYVRGLGERYTNSLLNGVPLPSPEPDKQAVPLDLFPSLILSDITITKTFTPDMPGDFAGGSVRIHTRDLPEKLLFQATLSAAFNTASVFRDRLSYRGSSTDWLGIDDGTRALPAEIPDYKVGRLLMKPDGSLITSDELTFYGRTINAYMSTRTALNLPNLSGNIVVGDTLKFGVNQRLGYSAALTYGRKFTTRKDEIIRDYTPRAPDPNNPPAPGTPVELDLRNDYKSETGLDQVFWGGFAGLTYRPTRGQTISLTGLHSRSSENEARFIRGYNDEKDRIIEDTRLRFISRSLTFGQLSGEHKLPVWNKPSIDWNLSLSLATADEPDTRETVYGADATSGIMSFEDTTQSGSHFFSNQSESGVSGGLDFAQPLRAGSSPTVMKLGSLFNVRSRSFDARRFRFTRGTATQDILRLPPDELFTDAYIGQIQLLEYTAANDAYRVGQDLFAGYVMVDTWVFPRLRVLLGARVEASTQTLDSFDPYAPELTPVKSELQTTDLLPSASAVIKTTDKSNLRLSVTRTLARPQLRELSPFLFIDYFGSRELQGNPDLNRTTIYNGDVRFELFPTPSEVLAVSVFYKQFYDPIEQVILPSSKGVISYQNAKLARNAGGEIEARKGLGFIHPVLADVTVLGNVTFVYSRVELDTSGITSQTNAERPLAGQSPFVVNLGVDYSSEKLGTSGRLLYNVFGSRIAQVGSSGLPDVYERPRHQVDATVAQKLGSHFGLKLAVENILNAPVVFTHGDGEVTEGNTTGEYRTGATFTLSATYTH